MADEITNKVLLEHIQGMNAELIEKIDTLEKKVDRGFEEAKQHRQALQEDLDASIAMLGKHQTKLDKISV